MQDRFFLSGAKIALSISDSPDSFSYGLSDSHLRDVSVEIARFLMAAGAHLFYGGDLRNSGYTELLCEIAARHHKLNPNSEAALTNYLPWPAARGLSPEELESRLVALGRYARILVLKPNNLGDIDHHEQKLEPPSARDWAENLTQMRALMTAECDVRIALGGKVSDYLGRMPGVAEEVSLNLRAKKPTFILGGFGGCARDIAEEFGLVNAPEEVRVWVGRNEFYSRTFEDLRNGLHRDENLALASSPHTDQIVALVLRGLHRLKNFTR